MPNPLKDHPNWLAVRDRALVPAGAWARERHDWVRANDPVYTSLRRPGRPEQIAAGVTLALIAAVAVFLLLFDWNWFRGPIGGWASARYDREIELQGDLDVKLFSWTPSARIRDLRVGGPDWASEKDTLTVDDAVASVRLMPLLSGRVEMPLVEIARPQVVLISTADGRQSWVLDPDKPDAGPMKLPPINRLVIRDGQVFLDEQGRNIRLNATVNAREGSDQTAGFHLEGRGTINGTPLTLEVRGGPFINIRRDRPYGFKAELSGVGTTLTADGSITRPFDLGHFNATLGLRGRDLADLYLLTGITTPNTPPYRLNGTLTRSDNVFTFNDFSGRVGSSDLSGDLKVDRVGDRRRVEADLYSRLLDIDDLASVLGGTPRVTASGDTVVTSGAPGKLLPDAPLNVERLRVMDGTLTYRAAQVKRNELDVRRVNLGARLKDGVLNLDPVAFDFNRGELDGTARINANSKVPYSTADFRLRGYPLESIIPARNGAPTVTGRAIGRVKLEGPGASIHDFAANSKGTLSLVVPQGQMRAAFAELLGINVTAGLGRLLSGDTGTSEIRCAVADFTVSGGTATARTFVIDTTPVLARGSGTINLGAETMNLRIDGETKSPRLIRLWSPINITGPLTAPRIGIDKAAVVGQVGLGTVLGALINPLVALLPFVDPGLAKDANCGALISSAR
ncbi:MAG: AsmA family protein [Brevundimonas sp.]|uniref:AsmA family protein n=1 Tax=Brevundimonas sp. TaxID=1871086 RepID=UPI00248A45AF|nr:AsmA family protein [Brevundimonas sp.]MDI1325333.1 AsmA family protein [Brevundimonas sp.]